MLRQDLEKLLCDTGHAINANNGKCPLIEDVLCRMTSVLVKLCPRQEPDAGPTSTLTIHHKRCDVGKWTVSEFQTLAAFVKHQQLSDAARLASLGIQLVLSEAHIPKGGELELVGWALEERITDGEFADMAELDICEDVEAVVPLYRGPTQFVAQLATGDAEGHFDGYEHETFKTAEEANARVEAWKGSAS